MSPDLTLCPGNTCPIRQSCYRFKAKPDKEGQAYFATLPYNWAAGRCESYWPMSEDSIPRGESK